MEYAVKLLEDMLRIYSPTGYESRLGGYLEEAMKNLGFHVETDRVGNVIGRIGEGDVEILLCGHMDTVPGEIPVKRIGYNLYGRGVVDAKGALAAMIMAAYKAGSKDIGGKARITVACLVDEEGESRGARELAASDKPPSYLVYGEPSGVDGIIIGYKGALKVSLEVSTAPGHSASPWLYPNAVEEAFEIWRILKREVMGSGSYFDSVTGCLTRIEGGEGFSRTPAKCVMEMDFRVPPGIPWRRVRASIEEKALSYAEGKENLRVRVWDGDGVDAFTASKDSPLVSAFSIAVRKATGKRPILLKKTGTSDLNILAQVWRIPMIAYGPGDSRLDHTPDEHLDVKEYLSSIEVLREALRWLIGIR
ncbi:MAG: M20/M25/M40 family metallo-hydrolase [Candidatus Bathyarchaeia archaeon]|nr:M20/M25/M40 family metallo-hydrolase [Candidatus Bathyarchaeota archaeon]